MAKKFWPDPDPKTTTVALSPATLDWALQNIEVFGDTYALPAAFEFEAIRHHWDEVRAWLSGQNLLLWKPRPRRTFLAPKTGYSFRSVTQLDPLEALIFSGLVHDVGADLERSRIEPGKLVVHSWRFSPDSSGQMFNPAYSWDSFSEACCLTSTRNRIDDNWNCTTRYP